MNIHPLIPLSPINHPPTLQRQANWASHLAKTRWGPSVMNDNIILQITQKSLFLLLRHCDFRAFVESHFWHEETLSLLIWLLFYCGSDFVFQEAWVATLRAK